MGALIDHGAVCGEDLCRQSVTAGPEDEPDEPTGHSAVSDSLVQSFSFALDSLPNSQVTVFRALWEQAITFVPQVAFGPQKSAVVAGLRGAAGTGCASAAC
jgi:hypothetical protein